MVCWFRPNGHFNVVKKEVYEYLQKFFGPEYFKVTEK